MKNIVEGYLNLLEGKTPQDASLPNPYDYQSIELREGISKKDMNVLGQWLQKNKKYFPPKTNLEPFGWLYYSGNEDYTEVTSKYVPKKKPDDLKAEYTIFDKNKSVGYVSYSYSLKWVSWVPGYNYATRGTMKMLDLLYKNKIINQFRIEKELIHTLIYEINYPSRKVAEKLHMTIYTKFRDDYLDFPNDYDPNKEYDNIKRVDYPHDSYGYKFKKQDIFWWQKKK